MTAYRFPIGPVPGPLGPLAQVVEVSEEGELIFATGATLEEAFQRLEADPAAQADWCGPARLSADGPHGAPNPAQFSALMRHALPLIDPDIRLLCENDKVTMALFVAFGVRWHLGGGLAPGTSRPFHFSTAGAFELEGHAIFSASQTGLTCIMVARLEQVRQIYESGISGTALPPDINNFGFILDAGPDWALDVMQDLTGQRFIARPFVRIDGKPADMSFGSAQLCALLAGGWPEDPSTDEPVESWFDLPVGTGTLTLTPVTP